MEADGDWTVTVTRPRPAEAPDFAKAASRGQRVSKPFRLEKGLTVFNTRHTGQATLVVHPLDHTGRKVELVVNQIGRHWGGQGGRAAPGASTG